MHKKQSMEEIYLENRHWVYGSFLRKTEAVETNDRKRDPVSYPLTLVRK